jgi:hypothetical protein
VQPPISKLGHMARPEEAGLRSRRSGRGREARSSLLLG